MKTRGGARKGAGRKPTGSKTAKESFSISLETISELEQAIPSGKRSGFVDAAILEKLKRPLKR